MSDKQNREQIRAGLWMVDGWHVEKRGSYWGIFEFPSHPPLFATTTLKQACDWVRSIGPRKKESPL